jgi:hypothetical protein
VVLEVRRVVHAWREQHDSGVRHALRRDGAQVFEQQVGIVLHGRDAVALEQFREEPHHHLAVFQHVRDAARHAQVVFQHVVLASVGAHDVDAGDVGVDVARDIHAHHFLAELRVLQHLVGRDLAGAQDVLLVVDVVDEVIQRLHALAQAGFEMAPFGRRDDARNDVERNQPLGAGVVPIDGERDTDAPEHQVGFRALVDETVGVLLGQPAAVGAITLPDGAIGSMHFIENLGGGHRGEGIHPVPGL